MIKYFKFLKIAVGATLSILIAYKCNLIFAPSAGIITLLTIQDTKKETIYLVLKRMGAFLIMLFLCSIIFYVFGYQGVSFGIFIFLFILICDVLNVQDAIAMNAVLATHFLAQGNMKASLIQNEVGLLLVGAGMGVILNLYNPRNIKDIRRSQMEIETAFKAILDRMAFYVLQVDKGNYTDDCFIPLERLIHTATKKAFENMNNHFFADTKYFIEYMEMRKKQVDILKNIYQHILMLSGVPLQAEGIALLLKHIAESLHESNNAAALLDELAKLKAFYKQDELPKSRMEFESRAVLFQILADLEQFLRRKKEFVEQLTEKEKECYWG
ncbi:aromatic acid exporter family protein [Anaeromicropila populeti]|uniref:Uncharacterized membrane protein YgaE, UPF0421/DUF939 family n=1 Tax=Anaeromicropila populeti TaxID=37658 RepID=A0A1I6JYW8_9FIRM|nr:aromatic acid exporter family protein [Anaeromicropila populeti]SFR84154.1 Uncharacterized membrane protein YgaE, UPF0421/DUF939 family [Anaeromicropila populeti]